MYFVREAHGVGGPMVLVVLSNFNVTPRGNGTVGTTGGPGVSGLFTSGPLARVNTSNVSMNLPSNRVNGSRINRAGVNTNEVICRRLAEVAGAVGRSGLGSGRTVISTVSGTLGGNATLRLVKLLSSNNIRDRVRRLCNVLRLTGGGNLGSICVRTFLSNHSIPPSDTTRCTSGLLGGLGRVNVNGITAIRNECCTVSESGG